MKIKKWIQDGNMGNLSCIGTTEELLDAVGRVMDKAYAHEIIGDVMFEGEDGKVYVGTVEFCIGEGNPEYVKQVTEEEYGV